MAPGIDVLIYPLNVCMTVDDTFYATTSWARFHQSVPSVHDVWINDVRVLNDW